MAQEDLINDTPGRFIVDPDRLFSNWGIWEIYTGTGPGAYVPNPDDEVRDWDRGVLRVASVDYTTGLSTLVLWEDPKTPNEISNEDILLGVTPGYQSESWRAYLDTNKIPHILQVDGRLHIYGSEAAYAKIFLGTDISVNGKVISAFYDQNGSFIDENIPLELVGTDTIENLAIKALKTGYTNYILPDGEVVTVVVYNVAGAVVTKVKLLIQNTTLVKRTEENLKYVKGISIISSFLSEADPTIIEFPINATVSSIPLQGKVEYSDGTSMILPIGLDNGSKMCLYGLKYYTPTVEGETKNLTLNYQLSPDEYAYMSPPTANGTLTERYYAKTTKKDSTYSVKLFMYPVWTGDVSGYTLDFWLYNVDRREFYRVPKGKIEIPEGSKSFDGLDFLSIQHLKVALDLSALDGKFNSYRHTQSFDIALKAAGDLNQTNWTINFSTGQLTPYGTGLSAKMKFINTNQWTLNVGNGFGSKEEWLRNIFYGINPLYDTYTESEAPAPTHFVVVTNRRETEFSVELWNNDLSIINDLNEGEVLYLRWIKRTPTNDLQLGVSGLVMHQIN